jgi:hypothetical protein
MYYSGIDIKLQNIYKKGGMLVGLFIRMQFLKSDSGIYHVF